MNLYEMAGHSIRRLNQNSTQVFSHRMQELGYDLTPVQFAAMNAIDSFPGIDQAGVAAHIAYDRATIGGVLDRLEQKGYISRMVSKRDARAREVQLTEMGAEVYTEILPVVRALQSEILPGLNKADRAKFMELATRVISNVGV